MSIVKLIVDPKQGQKFGKFQELNVLEAISFKQNMFEQDVETFDLIGKEGIENETFNTIICLPDNQTIILKNICNGRLSLLA